MNVFDEIGVGGLAFGGKIFGLPGDDAAAAGRACQFESESASDGWDFRKHFEGEREQGIAGQNGGGFIESDVAGGAAAAQCIVVHGGQIVMDQGVGVQQFQSAGGSDGLFGGAAARFAGGDAQCGPQAFPSGEYAVAHGLVEPFRAGFAGWENLFECAVCAIRAVLQVAFGIRHGGES